MSGYLWLREDGGHAVLVGLLGHFGGNLDRNLLDPLQVWVKPTNSKVLLRIDGTSNILHKNLNEKVRPPYVLTDHDSEKPSFKN